MLEFEVTTEQFIAAKTTFSPEKFIYRLAFISYIHEKSPDTWAILPFSFLETF